MEKVKDMYTAVAHSLLCDKILTLIKEKARRYAGKSMCLVIDEEFPANINLLPEHEAKNFLLKTKATKIEPGLILDSTLFFVKQLKNMKI